MKKYFVIAVLLGGVVFAGCTVVNPPKTILQGVSGPVLTATPIIFGGTNAMLTLRTPSTDLTHEDESSPYVGWNSVGDFALQVEILGADGIVSQLDLGEMRFGIPDSLVREGKFWESGNAFEIALADYNNDGQQDFTIGQRENDISYRYKIFTISSKGELSELKVGVGGYGTLAAQAVIAQNDGYSPLFDKTEKGFVTTRYVRELGEYETVEYQWRDNAFYEFPMSASSLGLLEGEMVGVWQDAPSVAAGWGDTYVFNADGTFDHYYSQMDCEKQTISQMGLWMMDGPSILLTINEEVVLEGGSLEPAIGSCVTEMERVGATRETVAIVPPETAAIVINPIDTEIAEGYPQMMFNDEPYWQISKNPADYNGLIK